MAEGRTGVQRVTVTPEEAGQKLVKFLERRLGREVPGGRVMRAIRKGEVRVDGKRAKPFDRVRKGQEIRIPPISISDQSKKHVKSPEGDLTAGLPILGCEKSILAVNKPAGLPVHGGSGHEDSVVARLKTMYPDAPFAPTPAHRLDRDTTGVLLTAMSYESLIKLQQAFKGREVRKEYLCWVVGEWKQHDPVALEDRLGKRGAPGAERIRSCETGRAAGAEAVLIRTSKRFSLLKVRLFTGRTHQIRVQLAERGFPLVGDRKYGGPACSQGLLLHSRRIALLGLKFECRPDWSGIFADSRTERA